MEKITDAEYSKAMDIVNQYNLQKREEFLLGLAMPCPSCGKETDSEGDCRKCGVIYLNGVHQIQSCDKNHTHSNECMIPYIKK